MIYNCYMHSSWNSSFLCHCQQGMEKEHNTNGIIFKDIDDNFEFT